MSLKSQSKIDSPNPDQVSRIVIVGSKHLWPGSRSAVPFQIRRRYPVLDTAFAQYGTPVYLRSDNGLEFIAQKVKDWLANKGVQTHYIDPSRTWQNAFGESFNVTVLREHLNCECFASLAEA